MQIGFYSISKKEFAFNTGPSVYKIFKNGTCIYVGYSKNGLCRIYVYPSQRHFRGNRYSAFKEADTITISFYETAPEALFIEQTEIHRLHPVYNKCQRCRWDKERRESKTKRK